MQRYNETTTATTCISTNAYIEQSDNVCLYSICFDGSEQSEFENFLATFKDNGKYNRDFSIILLALEKIIAKGALERLFRIEKNLITNIESATFTI